MVKSRNIDEVLTKLGISPTRYLDEGTFEYVLFDSNVMTIKKEKRIKEKVLKSQK